MGRVEAGQEIASQPAGRASHASGARQRPDQASGPLTSQPASQCARDA